MLVKNRIKIHFENQKKKKKVIIIYKVTVWSQVSFSKVIFEFNSGEKIMHIIINKRLSSWLNVNM